MLGHYTTAPTGWVCTCLCAIRILPDVLGFVKPFWLQVFWVRRGCAGRRVVSGEVESKRSFEVEEAIVLSRTNGGVVACFYALRI